MIKQTIHIIDFKILYNILDEIKDYLKFQILHYKDEENFLNSNNMNLNDSLILVKSNKQIFLNNNLLNFISRYNLSTTNQKRRDNEW